MPIAIRFALLIDIACIWLETCFPRLHSVWLFSLAPALRVGMLLLGTVIVLEVIDILKKTTAQGSKKPPTDEH